MKNMKKGEDALLINLLAPLITHWGYDRVFNCLVGIKSGAHGNFDNENSKNQNTFGSSNKRSAKWYKILHQAEISDEKKSLLFKLMEIFERKIFLPRIPDVRVFLEMHGDFEHNFKQRSEATSRIVSVLLKEDIDNLKRILENSDLSSVSDLGSLSDAIKSAGKILRPQSESSSNEINFHAVESEDINNIDSNNKSGVDQKTNFSTVGVCFYKINRDNINYTINFKNNEGENKRMVYIYRRLSEKYFFKKNPINNKNKK